MYLFIWQRASRLRSRQNERAKRTARGWGLGFAEKLDVGFEALALLRCVDSCVETHSKDYIRSEYHSNAHCYCRRSIPE